MNICILCVLFFYQLCLVNLKVTPSSKFTFACKSVRFHGFAVLSSGVSPDPDKLSALQSFPVLKALIDGKISIRYLIMW